MEKRDEDGCKRKGDGGFRDTSRIDRRTKPRQTYFPWWVSVCWLPTQCFVTRILAGDQAHFKWTYYIMSLANQCFVGIYITSPFRGEMGNRVSSPDMPKPLKPVYRLWTVNDNQRHIGFVQRKSISV